MLDVLIKNGKILDGSGSPWFLGNVGIRGDRIARIGKVEEDAKKIIDAKGRIVSPGFCDVHTHADIDLFCFSSLEGFALQGITTAVVGNCGFGTPNSDVHRFFWEKLFGLPRSSTRGIGYTGEETEGSRLNTVIPAGEWHSTMGFAELAHKVGIGINVTPLLGQAAVRYSVLGLEKVKPSQEQMIEMKEVVERCMKDGAIGLSIGSYKPGRFADPEEIVQLLEVVKDYDGIFTAHTRPSYPPSREGNLHGLREAVGIAKRVGIPLQVSHLWAEEPAHYPAETILKLIEDGRGEGVDIAFDVIPNFEHPVSYVMSAALFLHRGEMSVDDFAKAWEKQEFRETVYRSLVDVDDKCVVDWVGSTIQSPSLLIFNSGRAGVDGKPLGEITKDAREALDFMVKLYLENSPAWMASTYSREVLAELFDSPLSMPSSDWVGCISSVVNYGNFPWSFRFNVDRGVPLEEVVRKMSSLPLQRMKVFDRGLLRPDMKADICIFEPDLVRDNTTFANPYNKPSGIDFVLVNGSVVVENGEMTKATPGKVLLKA